MSKSREVIFARKRDLVQQQAKGNRPQTAGELTTPEEDLFETGLFGDHEPEVHAEVQIRARQRARQNLKSKF